MGFLDFFSRPPDLDKFAEKFMREMRRAGITEELRHDRENGRIIRGTGDKAASIHLGNFYRESLALPRSKRKAHLARCIRGITASHEMPENFESARSQLRPKIWARAMFEKSRLQVLIDGGDPSKFDIPEYEIGSHLIASLVYDMPDTMRSISREDLESWGTTYYEALEIARENLAQTQFLLAKIGDGFYSYSTGDNYDSCRLLVPDLLEKCEVEGDLVAMIPNRDSLLVTGTDDDAGLAAMLALTKQAQEEPRLLVPIPICLDGDAWVDWFPEKSHPLYGDFRDLAMRFYHQEYSDQKEMLERLHEKNGTDIFVASHTVMQKEGGSIFSYSAWTRGVPTLLPKTEWIAFGSVDDDDKGVLALAAWERTQAIVGRLMKPTDHYPLRVEVTDFPTSAELAELGTATP
jgi:hypothetical protein